MPHEGVAVKAAQLELQLFGCWDLRARGKPVTMSGREQKLVALLALQGQRPRSYVAGMLWPETTESRALASLRAAVLRTRRAGYELLVSNRSTIGLAPEVRVDVHELYGRAGDTVPMRIDADVETTFRLLSGSSLLPGWYDDWVVFERERVQHKRIRALESLAAAGLDSGNHELALTAALHAIAIEPIRESANALAIRAHLMAGNRADAIGQYDAFAQQLRDELAVAPTDEMAALVRPLLLSRGKPQHRGRS